MAIWAVSVTKGAQYRGVLERFSNVYHYSIPEISDMNTANADALIAEMVLVEKGIHSSAVSFLEGRVWGPIGQGEAASDTVLIKDLTGTGTASLDTNMSLDDVHVVSMRTNRQDSRSRPIWLRKYLRLQAGVGGSVYGPTVHARTAKLPTTALDRLRVYADDIAGVAVGTIGTGGGVGVLCAPSGAQVPAEAPRQVDLMEYLGIHDVRY